MINLFKYFIAISFIFLIVFDINFKSIPVLTTGRVVVLLLLFKYYKYLAKLKYELLVISMFAAVAFVQFLFSSDTTQLMRIIWFGFYVTCGSYLLSIEIKKNNIDINLAILIAISLQALLIIYLFFNVEYRYIVDDIIVIGANFDIDTLYRGIGFTSTAGAALSIIQGFGVIAGLIYLSEKNRHRSLVILLISLNLISTIFIGRTGLLMGVGSLVYYVIFVNKVFKKTSIIYFGVFILIATQINVFFNFIGDLIPGFSVDYFSNWVTSVFTGKSNTVNIILNKQEIPGITEATIVGTGLVKDPTGSGNASGSDIGYIQTYYSLGLIFSTLLYLYIYRLYIAKSKSFLFVWRIFLIAAIVVLEFKEPFLFKYSFPFLVMLLFNFKSKT